MKTTPRMRSRTLMTASLLGAVSLVAAACGTTSAKPTATTTPGVTASQIILGTTTPLSGPAAPGYSEIAPAAGAIFDYVNAHGGIFGRKIKFIIDNDQYNPTLTVPMTKQLVQADNVFATVGGLGTPTQLAVQPYLNSQKIPQLFIASGCACWTDSKYPYSFGFQPNYIVEGKILGSYVKRNFVGEKVGYLYQDDEFGMDGVKGLDQEISKSSIAGEQNYQGTSAGLAAGLGNQISALKNAGAKVVVLYTIPAATALALLAAAELRWSPQWVISSVGADPPTLAGLLSSFSKKAVTGTALLNGAITNAYLPPESDASNAWVKLSKSILTTYDKGYTAWDGNAEYGAALGYATVELLEAAGKNLTRPGLIKALETDGSKFATSGLVPFTYSASDHYGFSGSEIVKIENGNVNPVSPIYESTNTGPITTYTGSQAPVPNLFKGA